MQRYPGAQLLGAFPPGCDTEGAMPWALIRDVTPSPTEYILRNEPWCGVLAEVVLDGADHPVEFMHQVRACDRVSWSKLRFCKSVSGAAVGAAAVGVPAGARHPQQGAPGRSVEFHVEGGGVRGVRMLCTRRCRRC